MDSILPLVKSGENEPGNATTSPYGSTVENDNVQGSRDLAIVFAVIALALPFFVVSLRIFHPRRVVKYSAHDFLIFLAMFFGLFATAGVIAELRFGVKPKETLVRKNALVAAIVTTIEFFSSVTLGRLGAMLFALQEFGNKKQNPSRETTINRIVIITILVGASVQGILAVITTIASCSPVSSIVRPVLFAQDCRYYNDIQIVHAATDFWKNSIIVIMFTVFYIRRRSGNRIRYLNFIILAMGMITCICGLARTIFLRRHISEVLPPLRLITPKLLLVLEMDFVLISVGLLTISTAILPRHDDASSTERGSQNQPGPLNDHGVTSSRAKEMAMTTWDNLPDLEFQSDNPYNDFEKNSVKSKTFEKGTMISPMGNSYSCPIKAVLRQTAISRRSIARSLSISSPKDLTTTIKGEHVFIPPLPFTQDSSSALETPRYAEHTPSYSPRRLSLTSTATSSDLSSGPFSEDEDEDEEIFVQAGIARPQSVAEHTRDASVVTSGRKISWDIHEVGDESHHNLD